tara:strand:+ start:154 stop:702 length:549 start_codon:yes stop_codon:yes gene_type:complete
MNSKLKQYVIWFTGLSGSGKSTLAKLLKKKLNKKRYKSIIIDGDVFRSEKKYNKGFSKKNIIYNNTLIISHIKKIINIYNFVIVSVISPLKITRKKAKKIFGNKYIEVYVKCSIKELIKRDTKGLYKLANENKIKNLIGYKSKIMYQTSDYNKIIVNTQKNNIYKTFKKIKVDLKKKFNIKI